MLTCSLIIPTFNRLSQLKICLTGVFGLDKTNIELEIIVVNDGSSDSTKEYLETLSTKIKVINNLQNLGISGARNVGIKNSTNNILIFLDDDCVPTKDWLQNLLKPFKNKEVGFCFAPTFFVNKNYKGYFPERCVNVLNWPGAGNFACRKDILDKFGGFNASFDLFHNEDTELAVRLVANGVKYSYVSEAEVLHQPAIWTTKSLLSSAKNGSVWPILKKKYPKTYNKFGGPLKNKYIVDPLDYLYILLLPILIPVLLIRYLINGQTNFKLFFTKWPIWLLLKRYNIWRQALENKSFVI